MSREQKMQTRDLNGRVIEIGDVIVYAVRQGNVAVLNSYVVQDVTRSGQIKALPLTRGTTDDSTPIAEHGARVVTLNYPENRAAVTSKWSD